ncbi:MAG: GNAT family N-acetyltransferase [Acidobacteria bacterium]|nr:GNAT family N-acetyltransferase [Acidobacteriota bacterium]
MINQESLETSTASVKLDALAAQLVARARPLRFAVVQSPAEREVVYRLRYDIVIEQGWAKPEDLSEGLERDAYDARAVHIAGWDGEVLAATSRLVLPAPGHRLPTEEAFDLEITTDRPVVDISRICVAPGYRSRQHRVFWGLLGQTWIELRTRGFTQMCAILTPSVVARMSPSWGLQVVALGAPRPYWGEERFPVLIESAASVSTTASRPATGRFQPTNGILFGNQDSRRFSLGESIDL